MKVILLTAGLMLAAPTWACDIMQRALVTYACLELDATGECAAWDTERQKDARVWSRVPAEPDETVRSLWQLYNRMWALSPDHSEHAKESLDSLFGIVRREAQLTDCSLVGVPLRDVLAALGDPPAVLEIVIPEGEVAE